MGLWHEASLGGLTLAWRRIVLLLRGGGRISRLLLRGGGWISRLLLLWNTWWANSGGTWEATILGLIVRGSQIATGEVALLRGERWGWSWSCVGGFYAGRGR